MESFTKTTMTLFTICNSRAWFWVCVQFKGRGPTISVLGPLYTRSQGPTLSIFGLQIGPKLLINAGTLAPRVLNWPPKLMVSFFQPWGQYEAIKFSIY
jgi:hypothetical protein